MLGVLLRNLKNLLLGWAICVPLSLLVPKKKNLVLISKADGLARRDRRLTRKINEMKFELDKLQEQLKILKDLPQERDRYKAEASKYKKRVIKLEMELRKLKQGQGEKKPTESR